MRRRSLLAVVTATAVCAGAGWVALGSERSPRMRSEVSAAEGLRERVQEAGAGVGEKLHAPLDDVVCCNGEPAYDSTNTDGQAGSGTGVVAYHAGDRVGRRLRRPDARLFRTGYGAWEPTLGVTPAGNIFFAGRNSNVDPVALRSRDHARTWKAVPPAAHKISLDPYLWVDPATGRVFTSDLDPTVTCSPLSFSDDGGKSWTTNPVCGETDHQSVFGGPAPDGAAQPASYPNVVYYCAVSGGVGENTSTFSGCSKSLDGGKTFLPTGQPAYPPRAAPPGSTLPHCDGGHGHGVVDTRGTVYLPRGWCREPYLAISHDEGATWNQVKVSDKLLPQLPAHEAGVAVDKDGNVYFSWVAANGHPYVAVSRDRGKTWGRAMDVLPPGVTRVSAFTAGVDVGAPGKIAMVFMGTEDPRETPGADTTWNAYLVASANVLQQEPRFYAATMNDPESNPLWRGECGDLRCGNIGDFLDVVIGPQGTPWAALVDSCPGKNNECTDFAVATPRGEGVVATLVGTPRLR